MTPAVAPQKPQAGGPPAPKVRMPQPLSQGLGHCSPPLFPLQADLRLPQGRAGFRPQPSRTDP